jgi:hypothetical protein
MGIKRRQPESVLVQACLKLLSLLRIYSWRNNTGAAAVGTGGKARFIRFGKKGSADIFGVLPPDGRFLAVECKTETGRLSEDQEEFLDMINRNGGLGIVVRSIDELQEQVSRALNGTDSTPHDH